MGPPSGTLGGTTIHKDVLNSWSASNPTSNIPRWQYDDPSVSAQCDRFLISGSYLSLQNINLGYTLPKIWVNKIGLDNIRIYVAADNVYFWSKRKGFDHVALFQEEVVHPPIALREPSLVVLN